jgi:ribonuclease BN (tRNA processing enzyme)
VSEPSPISGHSVGLRAAGVGEFFRAAFSGASAGADGPWTHTFRVLPELTIPVDDFTRQWEVGQGVSVISIGYLGDDRPHRYLVKLRGADTLLLEPALEDYDKFTLFEEWHDQRR